MDKIDEVDSLGLDSVWEVDTPAASVVEAVACGQGCRGAGVQGCRGAGWRVEGGGSWRGFKCSAPPSLLWVWGLVWLLQELLVHVLVQGSAGWCRVVQGSAG